jgi:transcriptional regulator with XRE-family HTH domain
MGRQRKICDSNEFGPPISAKENYEVRLVPSKKSENDDDSSAHSAPIEERQVGEQIRELRRIKRLTLQQLADSVGVSVGYLSQIERNRSTLPVGILRKICDVLGMHISWFFPTGPSGPPSEKNFIVRASSRRRMTYTGLGVSEELLSPNLSGPLELLMSTIEPGADTGEYSHDGSEAGVVVAGVMELWVDDLYFVLNTGDSFSFSSTQRHRCRNPGDTPTKVVWVITPPHF